MGTSPESQKKHHMMREILEHVFYKLLRQDDPPTIPKRLLSMQKVASDMWSLPEEKSHPFQFTVDYLTLISGHSPCGAADPAS